MTDRAAADQPRRGLGRGLEVLIGGAIEPELAHLPVETIHPNPAISNRVRLLELPEDVLGMVERGELTDGHARAVLAVPDNEGRRRLAREIVTKGLTVRAAERAARWAGAKRKPRREAPGRVDPALAERVRIAC